MLGMEECQKRISKMVEQAKHEAKLPSQKPLSALVSDTALSYFTFFVFHILRLLWQQLFRL
jgi:hypothetical protein